MDELNHKLKSRGLPRANSKRRLQWVNDIAQLDFLLNKHPNREAIFGSDNKWELNLAEGSLDEL